MLENNNSLNLARVLQAYMGQNNISAHKLAQEIGVNRDTVLNIITHSGVTMSPTTVGYIISWLFKKGSNDAPAYAEPVDIPTVGDIVPVTVIKTVKGTSPKPRRAREVAMSDRLRNIVKENKK